MQDQPKTTTNHISESTDGDSSTNQRQTWLRWDDPDRAAGEGPANFPKWVVGILGLVWVAVIGFLFVMLRSH